MTLNNPRSGPGLVAEYQISALPYVTSSVAQSGSVTQINFPYVTSFLTVKNTSTAGELAIGFTYSGTLGTNKVTLGPNSSFGADFRVKQLFLTSTSGSSTSYELVAGLTLVQSRDFPVLTGSLTAMTGAFNYDGVG